MESVMSPDIDSYWEISNAKQIAKAGDDNTAFNPTQPQ